MWRVRLVVWSFVALVFLLVDAVLFVTKFSLMFTQGTARARILLALFVLCAFGCVACFNVARQNLTRHARRG
jgi:hypothetical protein